MWSVVKKMNIIFPEAISYGAIQIKLSQSFFSKKNHNFQHFFKKA